MSKPINITLPPPLKDWVQDWCARNGKPFSQLVSDLLREHQRKEVEWDQQHGAALRESPTPKYPAKSSRHAA